MKKIPFFAACAAFIIALPIGASSVSAEGCPSDPVEENGGEHWCFSAGENLGHVHLWKPKDFDAPKAVTVIYVHGFNLDADGGQVLGGGSGEDGCENAHYVDCVWDKHGLPGQFSASGMNALFVAVEGQNHAGQEPKWKSLGALMGSIGAHGGIKPPSDVTVLAHSAGIFTAEGFLGDARLKHLVPLDAMYMDAPKRIKKWRAAGGNRRLTLFGTRDGNEAVARVGKKLGCKSVAGLPASYSAAEAKAACVVDIDDQVTHMDLIRDGKAIPLALSRTLGPAPPEPEHHRKPWRPKHPSKRRHAVHHRKRR